MHICALLARHVKSRFVTLRLSHIIARRDTSPAHNANHNDDSHRHLAKWCVSRLSGGVYDANKCHAAPDFVDTITRKANKHEGGSIVSPDGLASMSFLRLPHPRTGPFLAHSQGTLSEACT